MFKVIMLPKLVWLKIFSYLSLTDKYYLSQTCWELYWCFFSPSLWQNLKLQWELVSSSRKVLNEENPDIKRLYKKYIHLIKKFGHAVKNLKIHIHGDSGRIDSMLICLLKEISMKCEAVENLTVNVATKKKLLEKNPQNYHILFETLQHMIHNRKLNALQIYACPQECLGGFHWT